MPFLYPDRIFICLIEQEISCHIYWVSWRHMFACHVTNLPLSYTNLLYNFSDSLSDSLRSIQLIETFQCKRQSVCKHSSFQNTVFHVHLLSKEWALHFWFTPEISAVSLKSQCSFSNEIRSFLLHRIPTTSTIHSFIIDSLI